MSDIYYHNKLMILTIEHGHTGWFKSNSDTTLKCNVPGSIPL